MDYRSWDESADEWYTMKDEGLCEINVEEQNVN